jgi:hypothetical protein
MKKSEVVEPFLSLVVRHNRERSKAAKSLADARNHLLCAKGDLGGRRGDVFQHLQGAFDDIRSFEEKETVPRLRRQKSPGRMAVQAVERFF